MTCATRKVEQNFRCLVKKIRERNHLCSRQVSAAAVLIGVQTVWVRGAGEEEEGQRQAGQQGTRGHNERGSWGPALEIQKGLADAEGVG